MMNTSSAKIFRRNILWLKMPVPLQALRTFHSSRMLWVGNWRQRAHLQRHLQFSVEDMLDVPPSSSSFSSFCLSKMELLLCSTILKACGCFVKLDVPDNAYMKISQYLIIRKGWHTSPLSSSSINNPMWSPRSVGFQSHQFFSALISVERCQSWACTLWGPNVGKGSAAPVTDLWQLLVVLLWGCQSFQTYVNVVQVFL